MVPVNRVVLVCEDEEAWRDHIRNAWQDALLPNGLRFVATGTEMLDYLLHRGRYALDGSSPAPDLVLLDIYLPDMDAADALRMMRSHPELAALTVVVLTISDAPHDIDRMKAAGAASYIVKPSSATSFAQYVKTMHEYWTQVDVGRRR